MIAVSYKLDDTFSPPTRGSLDKTEQALMAMWQRLNAILASTTMTEEELVEITAILNNVSYVFLYLEANDDQISYSHLIHWRDIFYCNSELDDRILSQLYNVICKEKITEQARLAYIDQLEQKRNHTDLENERMVEELRAESKAADTSLMYAQENFITRLGINSSGRPAAAYYKFITRSDNPNLRIKLTKAWHKISDQDVDNRSEIIDRIIALRHKKSLQNGTHSPLIETLGKCRIEQDSITTFLSNYLHNALKAEKELESRLVETYADSEAPFSHLSHFIRKQFSGKTVPVFNLDLCLEFAFSIARSVFGLDINIKSSPECPVIIADVTRSNQPVGRINFDLWIQNGRDRGANYTIGLRNRAEWREIVQRPEAYVSCRFSLSQDGERNITFQNAHSLYHEFGHALNHLLMHAHIPNQSGLEYLPLERLEFLSMWAEKWVYHSSFADAMEINEDERESLKVCQNAKKIEYISTFVERGTIALIDFQCHQHSGLTLRQAYSNLDQQYGISRYMRFADIPQYFSWPMFTANPGANFSYLFGAAWSMEAFSLFTNWEPSQEICPVPEDLFAPCFTAQMKTQQISSIRMTEFYTSCLRDR